MTRGTFHLEVSALSFAFADGDSLLDGVDLRLQRGERVALMGPSGVGKTTLCRLVAGLLRPIAGSVVLNGEQITGPRQAITISFQHYPCFPWLTVEENVRFGVRRQSKSRHVQAEYAADLLARVGLEDARRLYPHQLSGGMLQRLSLARSLVVNPKVLLLDEPFSALDVATKQSLIDLVLELQEERLFSLVVVLHSVEDALAVAERVDVLSGKPASITRSFPTDGMSPMDLHDQLIDVMNADEGFEGPKASGSSAH